MSRLAILVTFGWLMMAVPGQAAMISASGQQRYLETELDFCVPLIFTTLDFSGQEMPPSIVSIGFTMTMWDGDTDFGDFDRGNLILWLDDIDTGLPLNGFPNQRLATVTNWWVLSPSVQMLLMAALADGQVVADLMCLDRSNNILVIPDTYQATLFLTDAVIPEPPSVWLCAVGAMWLVRSLRSSRK